MIVSLINKGGAGKTTLATNLAFAFQKRGLSVLLIDADPQASARDWHSASEGCVLEVIGIDRPTIDKDILPLQDRYDLIFIDCGKFDISEKLLQRGAKIVKISDMVLIPVTPSPYDVWAAKDVVDLIKQRQEITDNKLKAGMIISRQIVNTVIGKDVKDALKEYQVPIFHYGTASRVIYATSAGKGKTVLHGEDLQAVNEINNIADELGYRLGLYNETHEYDIYLRMVKLLGRAYYDKETIE